MHIIIDGYNLLGVRGFFGSGTKMDIEVLRERLILDLCRYSLNKGHFITVVFDAWKLRGGNESQENRNGVHVIFTCEGEKADTVIQRFIRDAEQSVAVVTSDQEIIRTARTYRAMVMTSEVFQTKLQKIGVKAPQVSVGIEQYIKEKNEMDSELTRKNKKGNPRKLPKALRARNRRLKGF